MIVTVLLVVGAFLLAILLGVTAGLVAEGFNLPPTACGAVCLSVTLLALVEGLAAALP
ncbi:hypothetical protein [Nocardioides ochotonae]|uniref:hypothetical protein n=1 Tax=Nocardioides ochotonae TaxID=2685869 RepID=UPI001749370F|nr:hypothetical protein [Nocardioides ochotonae]